MICNLCDSTFHNISACRNNSVLWLYESGSQVTEHAAELCTLIMQSDSPWRNSKWKMLRLNEDLSNTPWGKVFHIHWALETFLGREPGGIVKALLARTESIVMVFPFTTGSQRETPIVCRHNTGTTSTELSALKFFRNSKRCRYYCTENN